MSKDKYLKYNTWKERVDKIQEARLNADRNRIRDEFEAEQHPQRIEQMREAERRAEIDELIRRLFVMPPQPPPVRVNENIGQLEIPDEVQFQRVVYNGGGLTFPNASKSSGITAEYWFPNSQVIRDFSVAPVGQAEEPQIVEDVEFNAE